MAKVLRLADETQNTTENLIGGPLKLIDGSWQTIPGETTTEETMELVAEGSDSTVIGAVNDVDELLRDVRLFHDDPINVSSIWLEANATSETAKRSLLYDGELVQQSHTQKGPLLDGKSNFYTLYLERHKYWEDTAPDAYNYTSSVAADSGILLLGGTWKPTIVEGSAEGRIHGFDMQTMPAHTSVTKVWAGIKPLYNGTGNSFTPLIEMEDGTAYNGGNVTSISNSTCGVSPNNTSVDNVIQVTSIASSATHYAGITLQDHGVTTEAVTEDYRGSFHVLCRCKIDSGTVAIHLEHAMYARQTDTIVNEPVYITNTNFELIELGEVTFPRHSPLISLANFTNEELQIHAEQISGSSTLDIDCLVLVPSRHFVKAEGSASAYGSASERRPTSFMTFEDDSVDALCVAGMFGTAPLTVQRQLDSTFNNWVWPSGGGVLVLAGETASGQHIGIDMNPRFSIYPRWHNHRE